MARTQRTGRQFIGSREGREERRAGPFDAVSFPRESVSRTWSSATIKSERVDRRQPTRTLVPSLSRLRVSFPWLRVRDARDGTTGWGHPAMCVNLRIHRSKTPCQQVAESACVGCLQVDEQCADHLTTDVAAGSPVPRSTTRSRAPRRTPATDSHSPRVSPQGEKSSASRSTLSINSEVRIFACIHALADASLLFGTCPKSKRLFNLLNTNSTCHRLR